MATHGYDQSGRLRSDGSKQAILSVCCRQVVTPVIVTVYPNEARWYERWRRRAMPPSLQLWSPRCSRCHHTGRGCCNMRVTLPNSRIRRVKEPRVTTGSWYPTSVRSRRHEIRVWRKEGKDGGWKIETINGDLHEFYVDIDTKLAIIWIQYILKSGSTNVLHVFTGTLKTTKHFVKWWNPLLPKMTK